MTILCRKIGPPRFLPGICLIWGCVIIGFGFAKQWDVLVGLRLVLGIMEAGFFPGCVYLLSTVSVRGILTGATHADQMSLYSGTPVTRLLNATPSSMLSEGSPVL